MFTMGLKGLSGHFFWSHGCLQDANFILISLYWLCEIRITVKPALSGHPRDPHYSPLSRGARLVQVHFTENKGRKIGLY